MDRFKINPAVAKRFVDKVCIVTGAGQGIGKSVAHRFGKEGGTVIIADISEIAAMKALQELEEFGITGMAVACDLSKFKDVEKLMSDTKKKFGKIDVLVNNVGGTIWIQPFENYTEEQCRQEIDRSMWTAVWCCRAVLPYMLEQGSGAIVNVGSTSPRGIYRVPYAAAKGAIFALTTSLAREVAKKGIRVNCVAPGATQVQDRLTLRKFEEEKGIEAEQEKWLKELGNYFDYQYPMGRYSKPEEQAAAIAFMASDEASFITGQILTVAGGEMVP